MGYLNDLAGSLDSSVASLISGYLQAPRKYKVFYIKKKGSDKLREVAQPSPDVKNVQRAIASTLLNQLPIHSCAKAYIKDLSIYDNAKEHKTNTYILKMDFRDFFPSIRPNDLLLCLEKNSIKLNDFEYTILKHYLFWRKRGDNGLRLCIGAPSSPIISNIVMYDIDCKIDSICQALNIPYTRYADDLTFSSNSIDTLNIVFDKVKNIISSQESPRLIINHNKTKFIGKGRSRRITGVIITNDGQVGVGRYLRKRVRALLHLYSNNRIKVNDIPYLQGMLSHVKNIELKYHEELLKKYNESLIKRLNLDASRIIKENRRNGVI
ncbi:TPA: retron St85 family RNA-directed DNA polymerase [Serratia fonticola]|nr:retron St85 family RNA-directed DNA polymerase [Serratia fonticola]